MRNLSCRVPLLLALLATCLGAQEDPVQLVRGQEGSWEQGVWSYTVVITGAGSRSEGSHGALYHDGVPLHGRSELDWYQTPWGPIGWVAPRATAWGEHGWMPLAGVPDASMPPRPEPTGPAAPLLRVEVLQVADEGPSASGWAVDQLRSAGEARPLHGAGSTILGHDWLLLHSTKLFGESRLRLLAGDAPDVLRLEIDGPLAQVVELPRRRGARLIVPLDLENLGQRIHLRCALELVSVGAAGPLPLILGPLAPAEAIIAAGVPAVVVRLPVAEGLRWEPQVPEGAVLGPATVTALRLGPRASHPLAALRPDGGGGPTWMEYVFPVNGSGEATIVITAHSAGQVAPWTAHVILGSDANP